MTLDANTLVKLAAADVTPVRQRTQYTCMATSMMMCLQANGIECNEDEVNDVMGARAMRGAAWEDAIACAQHYGMKTVLMCPTSITQLKTWTDMGVPVIIAWNPEKRDWAHASVVFDVDDDNTVHVADPNIPNPDKVTREVPEDEFYDRWAEKHSNGYLIRRTAMAVMREITEDGRQKWASTRTAMDEETWSQLHSQMTKALASGIRGSRPDSGDYWSSHVTLPRDIAHGMYLQCGSQHSPRKGYEVYLSVWTPMSAAEDDWLDLYDEIVGIITSARSAVGRLGRATLHNVGKATKLWIDVDEAKADMAAQLLIPLCKKLGQQIGKAVAEHAASPEHMGVYANLSIHPKVKDIMDSNPWNNLTVHPRVAEISTPVPTPSEPPVERAASVEDTNVLWEGLTTHASLGTALLPEDPLRDPNPDVEEDFEDLVSRMMLAAKSDDEDDDDEDKEGKFERGEDVPLSEMPKKLQENATNPPPSVKKVKEKIKSKKAGVELKGDKLHLRFMDQDELPPKGTVLAAFDDNWVVTDLGTIHNASGEQTLGRALVALRESEFDKLAARAPSGLYGYTKAVERDCQASVRKLHRHAVKLARAAVGRDGKVADFWGVHSKRGRSKAARMLLAALEANHRLAAEAGKTVAMGKEAAEKEAAYGYYGFRAKTARRALSACQALREEAGIVAASLHARRTDLHAKITGFLQMHSKKGKCAGSRLLFDAYPEPGLKLASQQDQPDDVAWLLAWQPEG